MSNPRLFQYAIIWHPTEKQTKDEGAKSKVLIEIKTILAMDEQKASIIAAMNIPVEYKDQLDQVEIAISPF